MAGLVPAIHVFPAEIVFYGRVHDLEGRGIPHAKVEVWQTDEHGYYDMQMYGDEKMDMRGTFTCDAEGKFHFRTVHPLGYYIPMDGPVGRLIRAQSRAGCRPAHIHFLITADGFRELVTSLYEGRDQYIDSDVVFGVSSSLIIEAKPKKPSLLALLASLEPIDEEFPDVDEKLLPLDPIDL